MQYFLKILRDIILCSDQTVVCIVFEQKLIISRYNLSPLLDLHIYIYLRYIGDEISLCFYVFPKFAIF